MSNAEFKIIDEKIGLFGGTLLLVGNVIAMTAFLLPAHLIADDGLGPEVAIAMMLVILPVTFSILSTLQIGGAMPAAGGSYVYGSRLISPFFGFLLPWIVIPSIWLGQLYLAFGFAEFMRFFPTFDWIPMWALMYAVMIPFIILNILGIRIVTQVQIVLVSIIIGGMLLFIVPGSLYIDTANYTGMFESGTGAFFLAIVSLSIAMHGFNLATDLGEELEDPVKNIPRVLGLSAVISIGLMVLLVVVAVGVVPLDFYIENRDAGVAYAAFEFLPTGGAYFVAFAAVVGAFTSLNTLYTAYSRQLMRAARDEAIPLYFAKLHPKYQTPHRAILLLAVPALLMVPPISSTTPVIMAAILSITSMIGAIISAVALWNLPKRFERRYEYSIYKLPRPVLKVVAIMSALVSSIFLAGVSLELGWILAIIFGWIILAYPAYRYRVRSLQEKKDVDLVKRMKSLHDYEEQRAEEGSRASESETEAETETPETQSNTSSTAED
ncbi:amino acid/polyamine/organocation transporter, APC superfamily (TC 2.A.3) [Natronorubrum sediminis]|uniref:Amino acid/polyamine/organocation transporter, APC superfamily (TC 2.A.3) n=1 Tax=Natronorubrum sediminis TaxID=640943 RepID=A0A1H6FWH3_9EURY|nr:APC family permease [Natronorubrum sediminis]SEH15136.1 amino acid/polyamine/organocation transporter, APC superfamily (TC 2.A.3) [Natronorubrum sediminis]